MAASLRELGGERVPAVPAPKAAKPAAAAKAAAEPAATPPRPRPVRKSPAGPAAPADPPRARPVRAADPAPAAPVGSRGPLPRSSKLGGALLIGVLALLLAGGLYLLLRGDDGGSEGGQAAEPTATATATATPQVVSEVVMRAANGSGAQGLLRVFRREDDGQLVFALAAEKMPPNRGQEVYAVWFTKRGGGARNLGYSQAQVAQDGMFTTGGPQQGQEADFAKWLVDYDTVVVARATNANARRPGPIVLRGTLPGGEG